MAKKQIVEKMLSPKQILNRQIEIKSLVKELDKKLEALVIRRKVIKDKINEIRDSKWQLMEEQWKIIPTEKVRENE
jgi:hypothetical protein